MHQYLQPGKKSNISMEKNQQKNPFFGNLKIRWAFIAGEPKGLTYGFTCQIIQAFCENSYLSSLTSHCLLLCAATLTRQRAHASREKNNQTDSIAYPECFCTNNPLA